MTYDVIATGSTGNAVLINGYILIDAGVPYKLLASCVQALKIVLLTHEHGDHFNPATIRRLHRERPLLRFGCCEWMVSHLVNAGVSARVIDVLIPGNVYVYSALGPGVRPEPLTHNVPNCGYHIFVNGQRLFYATDTGTLDGIEAKDYDLYLIEANHTQEDIVDRIKAKEAAGQYAYEYGAAENHLSLEQATDWIYQNIGPKGRYAFLHQHKDKTNEEDKNQ